MIANDLRHVRSRPAMQFSHVGPTYNTSRFSCSKVMACGEIWKLNPAGEANFTSIDSPQSRLSLLLPSSREGKDALVAGSGHSSLEESSKESLAAMRTFVTRRFSVCARLKGMFTRE